ncbi:MAG TPA: D-alanyl-D-alanine carboxypeptidase family protein [Verrucomicrobiae bacterium]|nr:D-alanyl-D-alanine carboxypeptidase family protein [Verrucomicrobiae bacterium]
MGAAVAVLAFGIMAPAASAQERYAAIVMDARTNEVLLEDQADEARFPASLTKMMTLYMLFEAIERGDVNMDTRMTASRNATRQPPSRLGLRCTRRGVCDSVTVDQAIRALVVQSANDVATLVAERLGGSEARFAANMSARARELGMSETRFANASGLPDARHRTTARDMAILSQALWRDFPEYYHYFTTPSFSWTRGSARSHNRLIGSVEGVDGIKTGYTRASGFNLATMAERNGRRVIVVVLGGETAAARDNQVAYLVEGAYEEYARREDPNAATFASLPTRRLDAAAPGVAAAPGGPSSPYSTYQGMVVETMSAVQAPLDGQGDQAEETTEDME